ncbi:C6 transcription factor [Aspergillus niger]|uniref:C6 transcription factor n=1 Tax=Aspergillus niger TaxID=5061 RepID=A0A100ITL1_ASPNG|nr:C6 transcription factor [Aspergillus niger]
MSARKVPPPSQPTSLGPPEAAIAGRTAGKVLIPRDRSRIVASPQIRTSRACDLCRQRKAKCNGAKPTCTQCEKFGTECRYSEQKRTQEKRELDMLRAAIKRHERMLQLLSLRPSGAAVSTSREDPYVVGLPQTEGLATQQTLSGSLDRTMELLQKQLRELHYVYQNVHDCDPTILPAVVDTIRRSSSVHEAASLLSQQMSSQSPGITLERMQRSWLTRLSGKPELVNRTPPYSVNAAERWTDIVDNAATSHLFSFFFVWDNPTWHIVDPVSFLGDFQRGGTHFCSSLLHLSYDFEKPWDRRMEMSTARRLLREVERLWQCDKMNISLPTMQAALLLGIFFCASGKDKIGVQYIRYGAQMGLQLGLHTSSPETGQTNPAEAARIRRAHKLIASAVYEVQTLSLQLARIPSVWPGPSELFLSKEEATAADVNQQWSPYPFTYPVYKPFFHTGLWSRRDLFVIINDVGDLQRQLSGQIDLSGWQQGAVLYQRLISLERNLPAVLRRILGEAMDSIATLILLYRVSHGWKSIPVMMVHYFMVAGVHAASHLESSKWREVLVSCVSGLWHMGLVWRICRPFLRTIQLVLQSKDETLIPIEAVSILKEFNERVWNQNEVKALAANYVVQHHPSQTLALDHDKNFQGKGLESLIRDFEKLSTDD